MPQEKQHSLNCTLLLNFFTHFHIIAIFISLKIFNFSFKDGDEISEEDNHIQINREKDYLGYYELVIHEVQKFDSGIYTCKAINKYGETQCEAKATTVGKSNTYICGS